MDMPTVTTPSSTVKKAEQSSTSQSITAAGIASIVIVVITLVLHIVMIVLCALNLTMIREIRKTMKSGIMPMSPSMRLQHTFKQPNVDPTTPANYDVVTPANYETVDGAAKRRDQNTMHLRVLQSGYDMDDSPELRRSIPHNSQHGSRDDLMDSDSSK